jgi:hypothetical protein
MRNRESDVARGRTSRAGGRSSRGRGSARSIKADDSES